MIGKLKIKNEKLKILFFGFWIVLVMVKYIILLGKRGGIW